MHCQSIRLDVLVGIKAFFGIKALHTKITLFLISFSASVVAWDEQQLTQHDLKVIGQKIYVNETGGNEKYLISWNDGEAFASLGIGHFIWFPEGLDSPFTETFPALIAHFKHHNVVIPEWLETSLECPWSSKAAFIAAQNSIEMNDLRTLLSSTFEYQVDFIYRRMRSSLPLMLADLNDESDKITITQNFNQLASSPLGLYSLIDYVNFKGEGVSHKERYNGEGWGLKDVLLNMQQDNDNIHKAFADACVFVLQRRISNSPQQDVERKWLAGWSNRCRTYQQQ